MFCSNCGASEQSPNAYCKTCGTYLRNLSFRGWFFSGDNPERAAWSFAVCGVLIAILCVCISILIIRAERSGDLTYLKYAAGLCWFIIGVLVPLSLMGFRMWRKMRRAQSTLNESEIAKNFRGVAPLPEARGRQLSDAESSSEAVTELLSSPSREFDDHKQAR